MFEKTGSHEYYLPVTCQLNQAPSPVYLPFTATTGDGRLDTLELKATSYDGRLDTFDSDNTTNKANMSILATNKQDKTKDLADTEV
jgi:hypothetical protein